MAQQLYIVWIEGLSARHGEKVEAIVTTKDKWGNPTKRFKYTLNMTSALRVAEKDIPAFKNLMVEMEIADWVINSDKTFIPTSYCPEGTRWKPSK